MVNNKDAVHMTKCHIFTLFSLVMVNSLYKDEQNDDERLFDLLRNEDMLQIKRVPSSIFKFKQCQHTKRKANPNQKMPSMFFVKYS